MRRIERALLVLICVLAIVEHRAQEPLTMVEAVAKAYTEFAPERIKDLRWIPGTDTYTFRSGSGVEELVMRGYVDDQRDEIFLDLEEVRAAFLAGGFVQPEEIPDFDFMDNERLLFKFKGQFWEYNFKWKALSKKISCTRLVQGHEFAPDYSRLAGIIGNDVYMSTKSQDTIALTFNNQSEIVSGQAVSRYEFGITKGLFWSNTGSKLAFYEKDESRVTDYEFMNYAPIPAVGEKVKYPMAGQSSEVVKVKIYDVASGKTITLDTGLPEDQYLTSVTWTENDKHVLIGHVDRSQNNFKLVRYDAKSGALDKVLFEEKDEEYVEPEQAPIMLKGSKGDFLWFSERDGFNHLYHYGKEGDLKGQLTSGERVMFEVVYQDSDNGLLYVTGTDSPLETVLYKLDLNSSAMVRITPEEGTHQVDMSGSGKHFIDTYRSLTHPRMITIKDTQGAIVKELLNAKDPLADRRIGITDIYMIKAKDGTDLYARMIKPSDFDPSKKYPVLVYVYGGPHVQLVKNSWMGGASLWMHHLTEKGYIVFTVDGRGSSNRGIEFEQAVHRQLGIRETEDQLAGVEHLKSLSYIDIDRMAIHGWSFGGFMTLNLMLRHPGVFKVGVAGGAVTDWRFYEVMYTERYMDEPKDNMAGYESTRMSDIAGNLEGDLLLIHGSNDDVVVPQHCMVMMNALINSDEQFDFFMYPGHKHNVRGPDRVHLMTKIIDYIEDKL